VYSHSRSRHCSDAPKFMGWVWVIYVRRSDRGCTTNIPLPPISSLATHLDATKLSIRLLCKYNLFASAPSFLLHWYRTITATGRSHLCLFVYWLFVRRLHSGLVPDIGLRLWNSTAPRAFSLINLLNSFISQVQHAVHSCSAHTAQSSVNSFLYKIQRV